jgi:hypothetical protein
MNTTERLSEIGLAAVKATTEYEKASVALAQLLLTRTEVKQSIRHEQEQRIALHNDDPLGPDNGLLRASQQREGELSLVLSRIDVSLTIAEERFRRAGGVL